MVNNSRGIKVSTIEKIISLRKNNHYTHRRISKILGIKYKEYIKNIRNIKSLGIYEYISKRKM